MAISRSPLNSFFDLGEDSPVGKRYFVPQVETQGQATSGGEGGMDTYGPGGLADYAWANPGRTEGYKAQGQPGDYGTLGTFDNTGGLLPGYGQGPANIQPGMSILGGGDGSQNWGQLQGKFYNAAPTEIPFKIKQEDGFLKSFMEGPMIPLAGFLAAGALGPASAGALGGVEGGAVAGLGATAGGGAMGGSALGTASGLGAGLGGLAGGDAALGGSSFLGDLPLAGDLSGTSLWSGAAELPWGVNQQFDWGAENMFGFEGTPTPTMSSSADMFGNFDMGYGPTGTEAFTGGAGAPMEASTLAEWLEKLKKLPPGTTNMLGKLASTGLEAFGANKQSNALTALANQYAAAGAPSKARFEASMTPGFDPTSIPGYQGALDNSLKTLLARLSAKEGNPFGNPAGLLEAQKQAMLGTALPAIQEYQRLNLGASGLANMNAAAPQLAQGAIGADNGVLRALGYGINSLTNPQPSLVDLLKLLQSSGLRLDSGGP